jgi:hypothetical protein
MAQTGMSVLGQNRTHAPQQNVSLFDHLVGALEKNSETLSGTSTFARHFLCCDWQTDNRPYPGSTAPSDLPRFYRQLEFRPARVQSFEREFAFKARELVAEAEVDPCTKSNMAVRPDQLSIARAARI